MRKESKKIETDDRQVKPAELSEQELDKVAGGGGAAVAEPPVKQKAGAVAPVASVAGISPVAKKG
jgi:hypothetical protein